MDITVVKWNKRIRFIWVRIDTNGTLVEVVMNLQFP